MQIMSFYMIMLKFLEIDNIACMFYADSTIPLQCLLSWTHLGRVSGFKPPNELVPVVKT